MQARGALERGRAAFTNRAWAQAREQLAAADAAAPLAPRDLDRLAVAMYLTGGEARCGEIWTRAHHGFLDSSDLPGAVRCAFWISFVAFLRGDEAQGAGWLGRAQRVLGRSGADCVERGYVLLPIAFRSIVRADHRAAFDTFGQSARIGERFGEVDLVTVARHGQGRALIRMGETARGMALLDEIMVAVTADEVAPIFAGVVYCSVIEACQEAFDLRRAAEWTSALSRWCDAQPDLVAYRGQCLVHRAEILQVRGAWGDSMREARRARERLSDPPDQAAMGAALYQLAELHRLRGEFTPAEHLYREAHRAGRSPQPGLAVLRLAQGRVDAAAAAIRHAVMESADVITRTRLLPAQVEILLAAGEVTAAREVARELSQIAERVDAPLLHVLAAQARGDVTLHEGDADGAVSPLRSALEGWRELDNPYETARVQVLMGRAYRVLGDEDSARLETDAASATFEQLGATVDLGRLERERGGNRREAPGGLTPREVEVLRLVSGGVTNRSIAEELVISERTVARHLSNIFVKLGLTSRAAATAYAYEHDLV